LKNGFSKKNLKIEIYLKNEDKKPHEVVISNIIGDIKKSVSKETE